MRLALVRGQTPTLESGSGDLGAEPDMRAELTRVLSIIREPRADAAAPACPQSQEEAEDWATTFALVERLGRAAREGVARANELEERAGAMARRAVEEITNLRRRVSEVEDLLRRSEARERASAAKLLAAEQRLHQIQRSLHEEVSALDAGSASATFRAERGAVQVSGVCAA